MIPKKGELHELPPYGEIVEFGIIRLTSDLIYCTVTYIPENAYFW